jgi:hypothetical protein
MPFHVLIVAISGRSVAIYSSDIYGFDFLLIPQKTPATSFKALIV